MSKRTTAQQNLSKAKALELAQRQLDRHQPRKYRLVAFADRMERVDGYWYIEVHPEPEGVSTADSTRRIVDAQMELQDQGLRIEITNMLPSAILNAEMLLPRFAQALGSENGRTKKRKSA